MGPATLQVGRGSLQLGYNRLLPRDDGRSRALFENPERTPYGPVDPEFVLLRVELPGEFPRSTGCVNVVSGAVDEHFRLRPYDRIALQTFRTRLDNLGCPLRNGGYGKFWQVYRAWRRRELEAWRSWPAIEELQPANPRVLIFPNRLS